LNPGGMAAHSPGVSPGKRWVKSNLAWFFRKNRDKLHPWKNLQF